MKNLKSIIGVMFCFLLVMTSCQKEEEMELITLEERVSPETAEDAQAKITERNCHSHEYLERQKLADPERAARLSAIEASLNAGDFNKMESGAVYTIPVVVHVVYKTAAQNISTTQIQSQLNVINEDFRRLNADANNTWSQAADSQIEFCLATVDPNGNTTTGITRTSTSQNSFTDDDKVKKTNQGGKSPWDTNKYMNIWVCNLGGFLGYAQFPGGPAATDGVVVDDNYFGTTGTAQAPFDKGRTLTHEIGHYLNLYHIWGDGGCNVDDNVADTPKSDAANYGCASNHSSCGNTDMVQNYMDYSDDACMNLFTTGQKNRMRALFGPGGSRASLIAPSNLVCSGSTGGGTGTGGTGTGGTGTGGTGTGGTGTGGTGTGGTTTTCAKPTGPSSSNITTTTAKVSVNVSATAEKYRVRYRKVGTTAWTVKTQINPFRTLTGLSPNSTYEYQFRARCETKWSGWTAKKTFKTLNNTGTGGSGCNGTEVRVRLKLDDYGSETSYEIVNLNNVVKASGGPYTDGNAGQIINDYHCLANGCYTLYIDDAFGDGMCCDYGNGNVKLYDEYGIVNSSNGNFGFFDYIDFCVSNGSGFREGRTTDPKSATVAKKVIIE